MANKATSNSPFDGSRLIKPSLVILAVLSIILVPLIGVVSYIVADNEAPPTPGPIVEMETTTLTPSVTPVQTDESTADLSTPTNKNTPTATLTPTLTLTPKIIDGTRTITRTSSPPTPSPTPITGTVITGFGSLNVRVGPGTCHTRIARLDSGKEIVILRRTPAGDWLEIEFSGRVMQRIAGDWAEVELPDKKIGYVSENFVEIPENLDIPTVDLEPTNCSTPSPTLLSSGGEPPIVPPLREFDPRGPTVLETIQPYSQYWYIFKANDSNPIDITFMFTPNVNVEGRKMEFFLHDKDETDIDWLPGQPIPSELPGITKDLIQFGTGSYPPKDRDGDLNTGELVWSTGGLVPGNWYYLRVVNRSAVTIRYCLIPKDEFSWVCPGN